MPLGVFRRSERKPARPGWEIRVIPGSEHRRADLRSVWPRVLHVAHGAAADGVHLILLHDREDERPVFSKSGSWSHRVSWLPRELSHRYGQTAFFAAVDDTLAYEECWRTKIRPQIDSPLLLPETAFSAQHSVADVWNRSRDMHRRKDLSDVQKAISRFRKIHRHRGTWRDTNQLVFSRSSVPHGSHCLLPWQDKKFTFRIPRGFHFDVSHSRGGNFRVLDRDGNMWQFSQYANVDPHGFLRGGH